MWNTFLSKKTAKKWQKINKKNDLGIFLSSLYRMTNDDKKGQKGTNIFECKLCDYLTSSNKDYKKHLSTRKHKNNDKMMTNDDILSQKIPKNPPSFICDCGRKYKYRQGLHAHKKKCIGVTNNITVENMVIEKVKNEMVKDEMLEFYKHEITELKKQNENLRQVTNNNTTNNQFNLNLFLNETCKDALSIQDFVKSLELSLKHLEYSKINGAEAGVMNILKEGLLGLDIQCRPIHCTDVKRETLYIKDTNNGWEKETHNKDKMKEAIFATQKRQAKLIQKWQDENPDWCDTPEMMDKYNEFVRTTFKDIDDKKVIKDIARVTEIDKK